MPDAPRTTLLIQDVIDAGVRLLYYVSDEEVTLSDATAWPPGELEAARALAQSGEGWLA
jgi:hypothetical protein